MTNPSQRVTLKPYGILINPATSPVQPERFSGLHNGVDYEELASDSGQEIPFYAIADGTVTRKQTVGGYGGLLVINHTIDGQIYTGLYGHVDLDSIDLSDGSVVEAGQRLGVLGDGFSSETDGERRHLHFSMQEGSSSDIRGYVTSQNALAGWIDPEGFLQNRSAALPE